MIIIRFLPLVTSLITYSESDFIFNDHLISSIKHLSYSLGTFQIDSV